MKGAAPIRLSTRQLAMVAEISDRAAKLAVKACVGGGTWRGVRLVAVQSPGRGGKRGQRYLLEVDSLPAELQQRAFELFTELAVAPAGRSAGPGKRGKDRKPRVDRKNTRLNSSHYCATRMPSSARQTNSIEPSKQTL